jgi:hypothetical protein
MSLQDVGLRMRLEVGDTIANANAAERAYSSLANAIQRATVAGNDQAALNYASAMEKYAKVLGIGEVETAAKPASTPQKAEPAPMRIIETATKVISKAPSISSAGLMQQVLH